MNNQSQTQAIINVLSRTRGLPDVLRKNLIQQVKIIAKLPNGQKKLADVYSKYTGNIKKIILSKIKPGLTEDSKLTILKKSAQTAEIKITNKANRAKLAQQAKTPKNK